jgi:hypothetical protein
MLIPSLVRPVVVLFAFGLVSAVSHGSFGQITGRSAPAKPKALCRTSANGESALQSDLMS